jgi:hypothetical protein
MTILSRLFIVGNLLFIWYAFMLILPQFSLWLNLPFGRWQMLSGSLAFIFVSWFMHRNKKTNSVSGLSFLAHTSLSIALIYGSLWYANTLLDVSFDGNWYHLDAIHLLEKGWNPIYEDLIKSETSFSHHYLTHFPKGAWLFGSNLMAATQEPEIGKASTLILCLSILFNSVYIFRTVLNLSKAISVLLAILWATNPIQILNLGSFYADGQLSALLSLGVIYAIQYGKTHQRSYLLLSVMSLVFLANTKYNGTAYSLLLMAALLVYLYLSKTKRIKSLIKLGLTYIIASFFFFGFNPFVTNFITKGHPFYPLNTGTQSVFNAEGNYPANFIEMNRVEKFVFSLFAQPEWAIQPKKSRLKELFKPVSYEAYNYGNANLAGFGPVLPEILLLIFPLGIFALTRLEPKKRWFFLGISFLLIVSILINPESWVMRYVPQFWIFVLLMIVAIVLHPKIKWIGIIAAFILLMGNIYLGYYYLKKCHDHTKELVDQVELVKHSKGVFMFYAGWTKPFQYRIERLGLDLSKQEILNPQDSLVKPFTGGLGAYFKKRTNK